MDDLQRLIEKYDKYEKEIAQLEAQLVELLRKHDILVEASLLLNEEELTHIISYNGPSGGGQGND